MLNVGENFHAPQAGSSDFENLANLVSSGFKKKLSKFPGFHKIDVVQFLQYVKTMQNSNFETHKFRLLATRFNASVCCRDGSNVVTKMSLEIDEQQYDTRGRSLTDNPSEELEKVLQETVLVGSIGAFTLDKQYLVFQPAQCKIF